MLILMGELVGLYIHEHRGLCNLPANNVSLSFHAKATAVQYHGLREVLVNLIGLKLVHFAQSTPHFQLYHQRSCECLI